MKFTKMHGLGNDYVYINTFKEKIEHYDKVSIFLSDRHRGVGSDGIILIMPSETADFRMRMFNPDGSESEMCGNGIRCVGKYVYDNNMTDKVNIDIETMVGIKKLELMPENGLVKKIRVDMGEPIIKPGEIPVQSNLERVVAEKINAGGSEWTITCVSMGNPHAVIYVDDVEKAPVNEIGSIIETHEIFPNRTNVEFVQPVRRDRLKMRVWERGTGETMACGTGACGVLASSVLNGISERKAVVSLLGGDLEIEWNKSDNHIYMTGPAETVYDGEIDISSIDI